MREREQCDNDDDDDVLPGAGGESSSADSLIAGICSRPRGTCNIEQKL